MAFRDYFDRIRQARKLFDDLPPESGAFVFEVFSIIGTSVLAWPFIGKFLSLTGRGIGAALIALSPAMPFDVRENNSFSTAPGRFYVTIVVYTLPITFFFCYGLNFILSLKSGTLLASTDIERINFIRDGYNQFLFAFVCPAYVSAAFCLIATVAISWKKLNNYSNEAAADPTSQKFVIQDATRLALFISISVLIVSLFIPQFLSDLADHAVTDGLYWFFDRARSGERVLNAAGVYYLVMNAILLFITAMAAFCYISMSIELFRLGKYIRTSIFALKTTEPHADARLKLKHNEQLLRASLSDFSYCYVIAKILVLLYAINIWVWQMSRAGNVANVNAAIAAILIVGMVVLVLPRLYLGSKWHRLKTEYARLMREVEEAAANADPSEDYDYKDVRSKSVRKLAILLDGIFAVFLGFILYTQYGNGSVLGFMIKEVSCFLKSTSTICGP